VADPALTPDLALKYLGELSPEVRAAVLLGLDDSVAACADPERAQRYRDLAVELFAEADAAGAADPPGQVQVSTLAGSVFAVRRDGWKLAVVAGPLALPSLMFYDMHSVLSDLEARAA
jgi:hypothetical protein